MYNKSILIGRLTADPELKRTQSDIPVCSFCISVDRRFSGKGEERKADFLNITSWRQQAEFVSRYFHKGDPIGVEGSIQTRNYEDKNGNKRTAVEIVTDSVFLVGGKSSKPSAENDATESYNRPKNDSNDFEEVSDDNDLPF